MKNHNVKELLNEIKSKSFIYWQKLCENDKETEIKVKLGKIKDMHKDKVTLNKLFDIIVEFKDQVNDRLDKLETRMDNLEKRVENIEKDVSVLKNDVSTLKSEAKKHGWNV